MAKFCTNCGSPVRDTAAFCAKCGTKLNPTPVEATTITYGTTAFPNRMKTGYELTAIDPASPVTINSADQVINVYYTKQQFSYSVNYYVDGVTQVN